MNPICEVCGKETRNRLKVSCGHLCLICEECIKDDPKIMRDECPVCQEREDTINVRGKFDDQL